eukprot:jgi/Botrbrau1/2630/Bobra.145_1s0048.1
MADAITLGQTGCSGVRRWSVLTLAFHPVAKLGTELPANRRTKPSPVAKWRGYRYPLINSFTSWWQRSTPSQRNARSSFESKWEDLYNGHVLMASTNSFLRDALQLSNQELLERYATPKLFRQLRALEALLRSDEVVWKPEVFWKHLGDLNAVARKVILLRQSLPRSIDIRRMVVHHPCFLEVPDDTILKSFPETVRSLGKHAASIINRDPKRSLLGDVKLSDRWSFALADWTWNMPIRWDPVDEEFTRRWDGEGAEATCHAVKQSLDPVEKQLDMLLVNSPREWPKDGGPRWYHVSPARVAERLVVLRTIFPPGINVAQIVAAYPEVMDAPEDLLRDFLSWAHEVLGWRWKDLIQMFPRSWLDEDYMRERVTYMKLRSVDAGGRLVEERKTKTSPQVLL